MQADIKTRNGRNLKVKALVDLGCIHTRIDEQLVKEKKIPTKAIDFSFKVFNTNGTKNREVTKVAPLEIEINGHNDFLLFKQCYDLIKQKQHLTKDGL